MSETQGEEWSNEREEECKRDVLVVGVCRAEGVMGQWLELSPAADISSISSNGMMAVCVAYCRLGRLSSEKERAREGERKRKKDRAVAICEESSPTFSVNP